MKWGLPSLLQAAPDLLWRICMTEMIEMIFDISLSPFANSYSFVVIPIAFAACYGVTALIFTLLRRF